MARSVTRLMNRIPESVTVKGKTDTNGYPFQEVNRSLSVRYPFERLKKSVQRVRRAVRTVCPSVRTVLTSIRSYCNIRLNGSRFRSNGSCIRSNGSCIRSNGSRIRSNGSRIRSKGSCIRSNGSCIRSNGYCSRLPDKKCSFEDLKQRSKGFNIYSRRIRYQNRSVQNVDCRLQTADWVQNAD